VILGGGVAVCLFTFVGTSPGHLCDSIAFLFTVMSVRLVVQMMHLDCSILLWLTSYYCH